MNKYREVFKPEPGESRDPGRIFYTITADDVGKRVIRTTAGPVNAGDVIGAILPIDVGKRLYRVPTDGGIEGQPVSWTWQCESDGQMITRQRREGTRS